MGTYQEEHKSRKIAITLDASDGTQAATDDRMFVAIDYTSENLALEAILANEPTSVYVQGLLCIRVGASLSPDLADPEKTIYRVKINYATPNLGGGQGGGGGADTDPEPDPEKPEDQSRRTFDFGTRGTVKLYAEYGQDSFKIDKNGTDTFDSSFGRAINVDADDVAPEGVEINGESCTWQITKVVSGAVATNAWFQARLNQVWTCNKATFFGFPPRTVACTGITGEYQNSGDFIITYNFEYRKYQSVVENGFHHLKVETRPGNWRSLGPIDAVTGFDYVWYRYRTKEKKPAASAGKAATIVRYLSSVHIARVYEDTNFALFGDL